MKFLTIVIPCFNEEKSIPDLIKNLESVDDRIQFFIIDNGSSDNSKNYLKKVENKLQENIKIFFKKENTGYGSGIYEGLLAAQPSTFIGWIHGDLQFEFEKLNTLYDKLNRNDFNSINIFYKGIRINRSKLESFISYCMGLIASIITSHKFYEINAQPTVFSSNLLEKVIHPPIDFTFDTYIYWLALTNNYKIVREKYSFPPRVYGSSKWNFGIISRLKFSKNLIKYFFYLRKLMPN